MSSQAGGYDAIVVDAQGRAILVADVRTLETILVALRGLHRVPDPYDEIVRLQAELRDVTDTLMQLSFNMANIQTWAESAAQKTREAIAPQKKEPT